MTPRKDYITLWIIGWGIVTIMFALQYTELGFWVSVATFCLVFGGVVFGIHKWFYHSYHAFRIEFSNEGYKYIGERHYTKSLRIPIGKHTCLIRVRPIIGVNFDEINVRFVEKRGNLFKHHYTNTNDNIVSVDSIDDKGLSEKLIKNRYKLETSPDLVGGIDGIYIPAYPRQTEDSLWLEVTVIANRKWHGLLSFRGSIEGHRRCIRCKATVIGIKNA